MNKITNLLKSLLVVAMLGIGSNAWGQVTSYSNDYEDATPNVDWTSGSTGRYTVAVEGTTDHYLHVADVSGGNNGTTITCSATNGKVTAGTDFYMSFDLILEGCNSSGRSSYFYIYDKNNSSITPILKIQQDNGGNYTGWTINNNTALTTGGKGTSNWYNYVLTRIGTKEYLTVTKKSNSTKVLDMVELTSLSTDGGLGKMTFETNRYYAGLYVDNMVVRALDTPAFTLSATEVTPAVDESTTVDVTGITGTVSVSSDDTSIATASYSDGTITINGVADGVANITVTAVNDGAKTTQTIAATVGSVATTTVTVNYLCGGSPVAEATTIDDVAIGSTLTANDITYSETIAGVGCRYTNPIFSVEFPYTVEENGVINITYTQQNAVSSLDVYANVNSTNYLLKSYELDGKYVGDAVTVTCPEYYLLDGTLYSTANHGSGGYYRWSHTLTGSDLEITYGTTVATNVVYYAEAENIEGATANSSSNADIRCSEATGAYFGAETDIVTLPAANYTIYTQVWGNAGTTFTFKAGEETIHEHTTTGALNPKNTSFLLTKAKTITVSASGSSGKVLDLVYLVRTGDAPTDTYTAQYYNSTSWENVYAYTYGDETLGAWPGTKLTATDGVYDVSFEAAAAPDGIIFNNGNSGDGNQTANLTFEDGAIYNYQGKLYACTATFTTNLGWENVYAYAWSGENESKVEQLGAWPGTEITATKGIYTVDFMANSVPEYIIFNNNSGSQTSDLAFVDGNAYSWKNYTVTFITEWANANAWAWNVVNDSPVNLCGDWPGTAMSGSDGTYTYTYTGVAAPEKILFNNGSDQTADLVFYDGGTYNASGDATVSKTITSAGWATYCSPYALDFSSTIANLDAAYIVTGGAAGVLTKTEVTGIVPANTGLLLKGEGDVAIPVASSDANVDVSANKLEGVTTNTVIDAEAGYVLMNDATNGLGFYQNSNDFTVGANTAYLPADFDVTSARFFLLDGGKTTSISEQLTVNSEKLVYDLQGRRVNSSLKPGLYIMSGKKVVIK